jgi:hypothetical protein
LAFQGAAGYSGSLFFWPREISEFMMRMPLLIAAAALVSLSACGRNDQTDKTQNADENLTAENIVANDVTAIDAVTGDAANMAADVNYEEYVNTLDNEAGANATSPPKQRRGAPAENAATNVPGNSTE